MTGPTDIARWFFWVHLRKAIRADRPRRMRLFAQLWRAQHLSAGKSRAIMAEEFRAILGEAPAETVAELVAEAYRAGFRANAAELLFDTLTADTAGQYLRIEGQANLDAARARGKGALILLPHAGAFFLMNAVLGYAGYPMTQYVARGLPPEAMAQANPELLAHTRWRVETREVREAAEDKLPVHFFAGRPARPHLLGCLQRNEVITLCFDGRLSRQFALVDFLGRKALLSPGPFQLAIESGAAILPAICHTPADGPEVAVLGTPLVPEPGEDVTALMTRFFAGEIDRLTRAHLADYGIYLLHCRKRRAVDDRPLFVDYAADDRWKHYVGLAETD